MDALALCHTISNSLAAALILAGGSIAIGIGVGLLIAYKRGDLKAAFMRGQMVQRQSDFDKRSAASRKGHNTRKAARLIQQDKDIATMLAVESDGSIVMGNQHELY